MIPCLAASGLGFDSIGMLTIGARSGWSERNQSNRSLRECLMVGFYFHPSDKDPSLGTPEKKATLGACFPDASTLVPL